MEAPSATDLLHHFLGVTASLLPMVNPFSTIPLLMSLTAGMSDAHRARQAALASRNAAIVMIVALLLGGLIMEFFGISIAALRIAGGLIVAFLGFRMLFPPPAPAPGNVGQPQSPQPADADFSFMPLAFPSLAGAGTIAVILSWTTHSAATEHLPTKLAGYAAVIAGILFVSLICWIVLRASNRLMRLMGPQGMDAMTRVMGLLLICIGVQFIAGGVRGFISDGKV